MIVIDASVLANVVGDDGLVGEAARRTLLAPAAASVPDLADVETVSVLRRRWLAGTLPARRFRHAVQHLAALPMQRYPTGPLMGRTYELRSNVTAYDAAYVSLAEGLRCPLLTADARLARAAGIACQVEIFAA